ncbi:hypothetical protein F8388_025247 [Cannabis sativa]|uniref:Uncharacterized protein n=1 Tax=Cannabis sativa TaxID=3483 RepID=A0A7J6FS60_CANSA|nr:hypothetical protein F8388_025247 [Cannabis sativa]
MPRHHHRLRRDEGGGGVFAEMRTMRNPRLRWEIFLENERRFGDGAFYGATAELEGVVVVNDDDDDRRRNARLLFADGRVLPPAQTEMEISSSSPSSSTAATGFVCGRFPASLTGICCSGGAG